MDRMTLSQGDRKRGKETEINKDSKRWRGRTEESEGGRGRGGERMNKRVQKGERGPY